jgi:hypothetical protein
MGNDSHGPPYRIPRSLLILLVKVRLMTRALSNEVLVFGSLCHAIFTKNKQPIVSTMNENIPHDTYRLHNTRRHDRCTSSAIIERMF